MKMLTVSLSSMGLKACGLCLPNENDSVYHFIEVSHKKAKWLEIFELCVK